MRSALLLFLLVANGIGFGLVTKPARDERRQLEGRVEQLRQAGEARASDLDQWKGLHSLVRLAEAELEPIPAQGNVQLASLQAALLNAEDGLAMQRSAMDIRLESEAPEGFWGFRIDLEANGDFESIYTYLDRVSRLGVPMALVKMALRENMPHRTSLRLEVTWTTLWPE